MRVVDVSDRDDVHDVAAMRVMDMADLVRYTVKTGSGEYSGSNLLPDGTVSSVGGWTNPYGTSGDKASAISSITFCAPSYIGEIKGTETVPTGCVRTEGGQLGTGATLIFGGVTIQ